MLPGHGQRLAGSAIPAPVDLSSVSVPCIPFRAMLLLTPAALAQFAYTDEFGDPCKNFAKCAADLMVMVRPSTLGCSCKIALSATNCSAPLS